LLGAALALAASLTWGVGDFFGGLKARALPALAVIAASQPFGLLALGIAVAARGRGFPGTEVLWAVPSALLGTIGVAAFYRGLAEGAMAVTAPIAGAGAIVPVAVGLATGDRPGVLRGIGFALAIVGVVVTSLEPGAERVRLASGAAWGVAALLCFGGFFVPMRAASRHDFLWATLVFRITSVTLVWVAMLALRRLPVLGVHRHLGALILIGLLDTGGNVFFAAASRHGLISAVSVLASLYPVVTVLLARVALHERTAATQQLGVVLTLAGVVAISAG
jgi:drug/metabolite transporter (DMT)-like permease